MGSINVNGANAVSANFYTKNYRLGITAPDLLSPVLSLTTWAVAGLGPAAATYRVKIVVGNTYGRTTSTQGPDVVTSGGNLTGRITFPPVPGAEFYDVFYSAVADPLWVGRITAAQLAAGCVITEVGTVGAGGVPGAVDVQVAGTGLAVASSFAQNTAYNLDNIPAINTRNHGILSLYVILSNQGYTAIPAVYLTPFYYHSEIGIWIESQGLTSISQPGGPALTFNSFHLPVRISIQAGGLLKVAVAFLPGLGASLDMHVCCEA